MFVVQPINTTASLNQSAAFSCIVSPVQTDSYSLVNITWMFRSESMIIGSGSGSESIDSITTVVISEGVMDRFPYLGTSILKIENVNLTNEGEYFCTARFTDDRNITSQPATLQISSNSGLTIIADSVLYVTYG